MKREQAPYTLIDPALVERVAQGVRETIEQARGSVSGNGPLPVTWFGPGKPIRPVAPPDVKGRAFDFPYAINTQIRPRAYEGITFDQLRTLADNYDLLRLCIETRKDQMSKLTFSVMPRLKHGEQVRPRADERCAELEEFFQRPDRKHSWDAWMRLLVEDQIVIDAPSIYCRRNLAGRPWALEVVDGATIKPLLDEWGRQPDPPVPAYQQVLKGLPAVNYTADELFYVPRNPRPHRVYGYCYSSDHEILTRARGWVLFSDLMPGEEVATRNIETGAFEWQTPSHIVNQPYLGKMIRFSSRAVDLLVTPDHRMLVDTLPRALGGHRGRKGDVLVRAFDLARHLNHEIKIPMTSTWTGVEIGRVTITAAEQPPIAVQASWHRSAHVRRAWSGYPLELSGDDYCALMGAYLAEGNVRSQGGIEIAQRSGSKGFAAYGALVARIVGGPAPHNGRAFIIARRTITDFFRQFGHAHEKFVPQDIMEATPRQIRIFWDHFVLGDGSFELRPNTSGRGDHPSRATRITTTSRRLAGQLVELAQKLGWSASVRKKASAGQAMICGRMCNARDSYVVSVRYSRGMAVKASVEQYSGTIHCVTVPNGVVYVRRNGKPAWCGNSPVEQIIATVNIGLRRQLAQMHHFTEGNIPEGLIGVPETWTPDQIRMFEERWNAMLENPALRRKVKFVPAGTTYQPTRNDAMLVDQFDEWLARIVCYALSLPPLPFVKMMNRSVAETSYESALKEGLEPMMAWLKGVLDDIIGRWFGYPDLEIVWDNYLDLKPEEKLQQNAMAFRTGFKSLDRCLIEAGEDPVGVDEPIVFGVGPMGFMFASDLVRAKKLGLTMPQMGMTGPGVPGGELPPGAMPGAGGDPVQQIEGLLAGVDPAILEAVGLASPAEVQQNDAYDTGYEEGVADAQADAQAVSMPVGSTLPAPRPIVQIAGTLRGAERTLKRLARAF